jgi:phosphatidylserine/phosphatidylglycerophosphate/cardiolipin synthase-like enzyme
MNKLFVLMCFFSLASCTHSEKHVNSSPMRTVAQDGSVKLSSYSPYKYELLFTDPDCGPYYYKEPQKTISGKTVTRKPQGVYCISRNDKKKSGDRPQSPQYRLIEWIKDPKTTEIHLTYLSFSNKVVKDALCEAGKRGVRIKLVMAQADTDLAEALVECNPDRIELRKRGQEGGLGYAHNKIFMVNPNSPDETKIAYSSGNMSSGPVTHHENWHFVTTNPKSHFAYMHRCALQAEWDEISGRSREEYIKAIRTCRANASKMAPEESDIKVFFIPAEGEPEDALTRRAASEFLLNGSEDGMFPGIKSASKIWLGCHRFFYSKMIRGLNSRMRSANKPELRIVADDDTFYKSFYKNDPEKFGLGDTDPAEWTNMENLIQLGANVKLMETNSEEHQLHHSKFLIFANNQGKFTSLFTGAANLTQAGFNKNWENSYYIMIPEVVQQFADHYEVTWNQMATAPGDLPLNALPSSLLQQ